MGADVKVEKAEKLALNIIQCYKYLSTNKSEFIMSKQLLRCGTSIGANIAEAVYAESHVDYIHKLSISQKEASETLYWLKLLYKSSYLPEDYYNELKNRCEEILYILIAIINALKAKK